MDDILKQTVEDNITLYLKDKLIFPFLNNFSKYYDERCYQMFTLELADIFKEYQPDYFSNNYHGEIGHYFFCSLYDEYVLQETLIDIIKSDSHEHFEGLKIYFNNLDAMTNSLSDIVEGNTIRFDFFDELFTLITLQSLNKTL